MLDCTFEVSFLGVLGGRVVSNMVGSRFVRYIVRGMRIYFSQDHMCRMLKNVRECSIRCTLSNPSSTKDCGVIVLLCSCVVN